MTQDLFDKFDLLYRDTVSQLSPDGRALLSRLEVVEPKRRGRGFEDLGSSALRLLSLASKHQPKSERPLISQALIAGLARHVIDRTIKAGVTQRHSQPDQIVVDLPFRLSIGFAARRLLFSQ